MNIFLLFFLLAFISSCATVPYTNRKAFIMLTPYEETYLGEQAFIEVKNNSKLSNNYLENDLIKKVGEKIALAANKPDYKWEFILIDDTATINAFCLPGGKVAFYSGILPLCKDENGIAVVMGHEIAHALARHGAERISQGELVKLAGRLLAAATSDSSQQKQDLLLTAYGLITTLGVMLPFSRKQEYEADYIGLILMAKAGYDPNTAVEFWTRMYELSKNKTIPEFLSTHPSDKNRIKEIKNKIPEALKYYKK
jgi:predicted Zn-dependent protease